MVRVVGVALADDGLQHAAHSGRLEHVADAGDGRDDVVRDGVHSRGRALLHRAGVLPVRVVHGRVRHSRGTGRDHMDAALDKLLHRPIVEQDRRGVRLCRDAGCAGAAKRGSLEMGPDVGQPAQRRHLAMPRAKTLRSTPCRCVDSTGAGCPRRAERVLRSTGRLRYLRCAATSVFRWRG